MFLVQTESKKAKTSRIKLSPASKDNMFLVKTKIKETKTSKPKTTRETTPKVSPKIIHETTTETLPEATSKLKEIVNIHDHFLVLCRLDGKTLESSSP